MTSPATIARKRAGAAQLHRVSAGEAMHRGVLSVPFQTPLTKVAEMMARYRMHCVVALDERGEYQTRYWGLIPAAELVRIATTQDLEDRTAGGSMTSQVVTVEPADSVHDAAELMSDHEVDHVIGPSASSRRSTSRRCSRASARTRPAARTASRS